MHRWQQKCKWNFILFNFCIITHFFLIKALDPNCHNSWRDHFKVYSLTPSPHKSTSQQWRGLSFGPHDKISGLRPCLRALKERQGQNWPRKNLLPNFLMKIKVAPCFFTDHWLSVKINLFFFSGVPLSIYFRHLTWTPRRSSWSHPLGKVVKHAGYFVLWPDIARFPVCRRLFGVCKVIFLTIVPRVNSSKCSIQLFLWSSLLQRVSSSADCDPDAWPFVHGLWRLDASMISRFDLQIKIDKSFLLRPWKWFLTFYIFCYPLLLN